MRGNLSKRTCSPAPLPKSTRTKRIMKWDSVIAIPLFLIFLSDRGLGGTRELATAKANLVFAPPVRW